MLVGCPLDIAIALYIILFLCSPVDLLPFVCGICLPCLPSTCLVLILTRRTFKFCRTDDIRVLGISDMDPGNLCITTKTSYSVVGSTSDLSPAVFFLGLLD